MATAATSAAAAAGLTTAQDVYDRQIRLWGADAQAKMAQTTVLYIHVTGLSAEVLKNLVLAGIHAALWDPRPFPSAVAVTGSPNVFIPPNVVGAQYQYQQQQQQHIPCNEGEGKYNKDEQGIDDPDTANKDSIHNKKHRSMTVAEIVQEAVQDLNPLLGECPIVSQQGSILADLDADALKPYSMVVASHLPSRHEAIRLAQAVTANGGQFYLADAFGMHAACIIDLGASFQYRPELATSSVVRGMSGTSSSQPMLGDWTSLASHIPLAEILSTPLTDCVNRFHKQPPETWVRYQCLWQYLDQHKGAWPTSKEDFDVFVQESFDWLQQSCPHFFKHDSPYFRSISNRLNSNKDHLDKNGSKDDDVPMTTTDDRYVRRWLRGLARTSQAEIAPVCSVMGGLMGNEIIKAISGKGQPANNTLLFDGNTCKAWSFFVQPKQQQQQTEPH